jgi:hypothetical protein
MDLSVEDLLRDLSYSGLQAGEVRKAFFSRARDQGRDWKHDLHALLAIYHSIGNNPSHLTNPEKVKNTETGKAANELLNLYNIRQRKTGRGVVVTLPRLAIAFCHELLKVKEIAGGVGALQNQFSKSGLPSKFQDPALAFIATQRGFGNEYRAYHQLFSVALQKDCTPEEADHWLEVALSGAEGDPYASGSDPDKVLALELEADTEP